MRAFLTLCGSLCCLPALAGPPPATGLQSSQLAVVINDDEPNSVAIGEYYRQARNIPACNVVHVNIPGKPRKLTADQFRHLRNVIELQLPPGIQAVLMVWTAPYAVECNAITAAFTLGFDAGLCEKPCEASKPSPYFNAASSRPYPDFGLRLSMLMPTESVEEAKALIMRGKASGFRVQPATAYYLATSETARNSRSVYFPRSMVLPQQQLTIRTLRADSIADVKDIMVYQTGKAKVEQLETLQFLPGALADHLTSFGGDLLGESQMSSLRWLEAGATASYGSVSEPCNYWQKFPHPTVLLKHYLGGATAIEAYWRSVAWPAQGLFIGEPLAAPYRPH
ncbi:TIGR03790 family protein [Rugamonas apoptosis]|uniref:TIGR03790 family protein n=1 Tax=Rugamonas apoptosis TaxID=2758570 RepID=UPI00288348E5|nr:TIGR03790 family protein [Rugamonas apoptosis]